MRNEPSQGLHPSRSESIIHPRLCFDDVAWEKREAVADGRVRQYSKPEILQDVGQFLVRHHRPGDANISFQMRYENANTAIIRFPQPRATLFPEEKVSNECHSLLWPSLNKHDTKMYDALNAPECPKEACGMLDPHVNEAKLEAIFSEATSRLLQLSRPSLPWIGSLNQVDDFTWEVTKRPLSMAMNTLIQLRSLPQSKLLTTIFDTTSSCFELLAELHIAHLVNQHDDAVDSADDCRRKIVARYLFRKPARECRLTQRLACFDKGPFKIWCDDFRPANILMNEELKIVVGFSFAPPWWLLIEKPEYWPRGLDDWCHEYERRLQTFLGATRYKEDKLIGQGSLKSTQRLSDMMQHSWESGDFWIASAARNNFAFDLNWKQTLDFLGPDERVEIERFLATKLGEMKTRELAWDPDDYTKDAMEKVFGDNPAKGDEDGGIRNGTNGDDEMARIS
ncbi:hypothetical protein BO79DRAFT_224229 [Aspergillus costaricaensis CBS 115574]|uniref:Uncharacterized protein n=1 Tax=Aspergillus costaricaensis CBS 115574 TaxID=1448317 RepID=A0ACD1IT98_9EURO|nr:hypothetical protein BO79DRAFT_224229 [Aspergillus costaricaensis CBS 115574]RAK93767.1 hypothetical protein BO79DRAFT_224229 [Aspergillus costaricaensis CBS 115574]